MSQGGLLLESAPAVSFLPSEDLGRSARFFNGLLGLPLVSQSPFACVFLCGSTTLRVTHVDGLHPQPFTVFGWQVAELRSTVAWLRERGVNLLRYEGLGQDEDGVWTTPGDDLVVWFHDPDGNVLSLTEHARH